MVVVAVKGARNVVNLGAADLYISTEPLAQLTPPAMGVYPGLVGIAPGRISTLVGEVSGRCTRQRRWIEGWERMRRC